MAQAALITLRDLSNHGAASDFLGQFKIRPIEITVETGGALGVMTAKWRYVGDTAWSSAELSEPTATWTWATPDPAFADVVFPAKTYTAGNAWTIASSGAVTPQGVTPAGPTATRVDVVAAVIAAVTSDVVTWTQPRVVAPILSLGEGQKGWAAQVAVYRLKSRQGMTPAAAGSGDTNLFLLAEAAEKNFKSIGVSDNRPPDLIDSSPGGTVGAGFVGPASRSPRGFGDF